MKRFEVEQTGVVCDNVTQIRTWFDSMSDAIFYADLMNELSSHTKPEFIIQLGGDDSIPNRIGVD